MANYIGAARTNYFKVKDDKAFLDAMGDISNIEVVQNENGYALLGDDPDSGSFPSWDHDFETDEDIEIELSKIVASHLVDNEVAIFMEAGAEKLRYINGYAEAVNNKGEHQEISLMDIYDRINELTDTPENVSRCEY